MDLHVFLMLNPPPTSLLGSSQGTRPEHLSHASNLDWQSVSQLIIHVFQCYALRSSHPHLLSQCASLFYTSVSLFLSCIQGYRCMSYLSMLDINCISSTTFTDVSPFQQVVFLFVSGFLYWAKTFECNKVPFAYFLFYFFCFMRQI